MASGCEGRKLGEEMPLSSSKLLEAKEKLNVILLNPQEAVTGKVTAKESFACRSLVTLTVVPHFYGVRAPAEFIQIKTTVEEMKWGRQEGCEAKT